MTSLRTGDTGIAYWENDDGDPGPRKMIGMFELIELIDDDADLELWTVNIGGFITDIWVDPDDVPAHTLRLDSGAYD